MSYTGRLSRWFFVGFVCLACLAGCGDGRTRSVISSNGGGDNKPFWFIQAGDPQLGGLSGMEASVAKFDELADTANRLKPAFVVIVGDLVHTGTNAEQVDAFDGILKKFQMPVLLVPGNHDDPATFLKRYGPNYYVAKYDNCSFICLDSNLYRATATPESAEEQWKWMEEQLKQAKRDGKAHIIVVMHHPPRSIPGKKRFDALMRDNGVQVVLAGHLHQTAEYPSDGYTVFTVAGTSWSIDADKGLGFRIFKVYPDRIEQEYVNLGNAPARVDLSCPTTMPTTSQQTR